MSSITAAMLPALLGRPVAYQPVFTRLPGVTVQGAIFLSQALFLTNTPTATKRDGWFWKEQCGEQDSWEAETGMSAKQQMTARKQLVRIGVLEEKRKGVPAKSWYRVKSEALAEHLARALSDEAEEKPPVTPAVAQNPPTGDSENPKEENQETTEGSAQNCPDGEFLQRLQQRVPPLSQAPATESQPNVFERAAQQDDDGTPPPTQDRRFSMTLDWQPDPDQLAAACVRLGLPDDTQPAPHQLAKFCAHHADRPERQNGAMNWATKLADWIRNDRNAPGGSHAQRPDAHRPSRGGNDRDEVRRQLADPLDTSWADGMWPDDEAPATGAQAGDHRPGQQNFYPAGSDFPEDVLECVPECGHAQAEPPRTCPGAGALADAADPANAGTQHE